MGSFEKLGILVIVVIIVMILAVAIHQWGAGVDDITTTPLLELASSPGPLVVDYDEPGDVPLVLGDKRRRPRPDAQTWPAGIPKRYVVQRNDALWNLVFKDWKLRESFIAEITRANPGLNVMRMQPGDTLKIPDPSAYRRLSSSKRTKPTPKTPLTRKYEIQIGDNLETIARTHLGDKRRWREIKALNPGLNEKKLKPFQVILVPVK